MVSDTLCRGRTGCFGKAENFTAQAEHGRFKAEACTCAWLVKTGCQNPAVAGMGILGGIFLDIPCEGKQLFQLFYGKIKWTH